MEYWKDIVGYEGLYQISDLGRVKALAKVLRIKNGYALRKERIFKPGVKENDYLFVQLSKANEKIKCFYVHRLVAIHFIPNPANKPDVNHKFCNKKDNRATSLEWVTKSENLYHSFKNGIHKPTRGTISKRAKLTDEKVIDIKSIYQAGGISIRKLADDYGVHHSVINGILQGKRWPHIKPVNK